MQTSKLSPSKSSPSNSPPLPKLSLAKLNAWNGDTCSLECIHIAEDNHNVKSFSFRSVEPAYFDFYPGQHLTFIVPAYDDEVFRTYTIASSPTTPYVITITNKRMVGGVVTNWMHDVLQVGDRLEAMDIGGTFSPALDQVTGNLLLLSGGSGITPMLSTARFIKGLNLDWDVVFVHSAQTKEDLIAREELETIAENLPSFKLCWVCDNGHVDDDWDGASGFLTQELLAELVPDWAERETYCCGPAPYMDNVQYILGELGYDMNRYHMESFEFGQSSASVKEVDEATPTTLDPDVDIPEENVQEEFSVTLTKSEKLISVSPTKTLLSSIKQAGVRAPFACSQGVCGTCRTLLVSGEVEMNHQGGLLKRHEEEGYILTCCSTPKSDIVLDI